MKVLVIYAHPDPSSFNHAVLSSFTKGLKDGGNTYEVTDLYAAQFNLSFGRDDFAQFTGEQLPHDVLDQQAKIASADGLVFIFPIWWLSCPAILKGWIERVFSNGFAYRITDKGMVGNLKQEKALLINTTGGPEEKYQALGREELIKSFFRNILKYDCGIRNIEHVFLYGLDSSDDETRGKYLERVYLLGKEFAVGC